MVYCKYEDEHGCRCCKKNAVYGEEPGKAEYCGLHNDQGWPDVVNPRCFCGKIASWGPRGTKKRKYCAPHGRKIEGIEDVMHSKCKCGKCEPTFAKPGNKAVCCKDCMEDGMINVRSPTCEVDGCDTRPSYGPEGGPATRCKTHAEEGMKDVAHKQCAVDGCKTQPSFGPEGGPATHCGPHAEEGMKNVNAKRCAVDGCDTIPSFAYEGNLAEYCGLHALAGMKNVNAKECEVDGCDTRPSYGREGGPATRCKTHAEEGMKDVNAKECEVDGCTTRPSYGREGGPATRCKTHAEEGMKDVVSKQCEVDGCETIPSFGFEEGPATHCGPHALPGMDNVHAKKCIKCGLFQVNRPPYLCSYCNPNTSKYQKTREMTVKKLLESTTDLKNPIHDKPVGGECGKYRPDFLYDAATHYVVVEVDEDQHRGYDPECERVRMINILGALGMRCVFIRFNPDAFKIDGKTVRVFEKKRHELLLKTIREYMKPSVDPTLSQTIDVVYLYYDDAETRTDMLC